MSLLGRCTALDAADQHVGAGSAQEHVAAEHADQHVVAAVADQDVGVVQALVGARGVGLDLRIVQVVVVGSDQDLGATRSLNVGGVDVDTLQGEREGEGGGRGANGGAAHGRLLWDGCLPPRMPGPRCVRPPGWGRNRLGCGGSPTLRAGRASGCTDRVRQIDPAGLAMAMA